MEPLQVLHTPQALDAVVRELPRLLLASLRVGIVFASLPAPFGSVTPVTLRLSVSLAVTLAVYSATMAGADPIPVEVVTLLRAAVGELVVGAVMGLTVRVTLAAAEIAGSAIGDSIGLSFASTVDPTQGEVVVPTTQLLAGLATLVFLGIDGHHAVLRAISASFELAPVGQTLDGLALDGALRTGSRALAWGLQIAAPVVAMMFLVQLGTALASRAAPRVHLLAFSFSILIAAGLLVLWVSAPAVVTAVTVQVRRAPVALHALLGGG